VNHLASVTLSFDLTGVHHERVTSHEIGHILGLHHVLDNSDRLMYSGTNGMALSEEEITVARYAAQGLLDGLR
jgi:predicted Zn-dependent protease